MLQEYNTAQHHRHVSKRAPSSRFFRRRNSKTVLFGIRKAQSIMKGSFLILSITCRFCFLIKDNQPTIQKGNFLPFLVTSNFVPLALPLILLLLFRSTAMTPMLSKLFRPRASRVNTAAASALLDGYRAWPVSWPPS